MEGATGSLLAALGEIADVTSAKLLLEWDEQVKMPPGGASVRAEQLATLTRIAHERLASGELGDLLDSAAREAEGLDPDSFESRLVAITRRDREKALRVPAELRSEIARASSIAIHAWSEARERADFPSFLPHLERIVELTHRYAECFEFDHPYDPLLDDYEPGMTTAELRPVLDRVRDGTVGLLERIGASDVDLDASCLHGEFEIDAQERFAREVAGRLPLEPGSWRVDPTVHPFAVGVGIGDLRITTRFDPGYIGTALWAVIHEVGHAMYHNGIDPRLERTPLCRSASLGFDESQSRLWENWVGRGRPYLGHIAPLLASSFPERFAGVEPETIYRAANRVEPSLIRVEADEVTYNLHIVLRFELETALLERALEPRDLPEAWRAKTKELLGIEPADDAEGVLQDVHWASGSLGYFPTYSLGNVIAAQLWDAARAALPALDDQLSAGELTELREFLRARVHRFGGMYEPREMIERAVGGPLDPEPLLRHLEAKFGELYELDAPEAADGEGER